MRGRIILAEVRLDLDDAGSNLVRCAGVDDEKSADQFAGDLLRFPRQK